MTDSPSNRTFRQSDPRAPGPRTIEQCVAAWQRITHALQADDELAGDEQALVAMLDADPSILSPDELLRRFIAAIAFAESREAEAKAYAIGMRARQQRYANRAAAMRSELTEIMQVLERSKFTGSPFGTAWLRASKPSAVVIDADKLPDEFWRWERHLKQRELTAALRNGEAVDGAVLSNPMPVLALRFEKAGADDDTVEAEG
jgi:hypothetical protein